MSLVTGATASAPPPEVDVANVPYDLQFEAYCYTEDIPSLDNFIWHTDKRSYPDKFYCKIDKIVLSSVWTNDLKCFYNVDAMENSKYYMLLGRLLPSSPSENPILVKLAIPVNGWFFFGEEASRESNGCFWVKDHEGTWYQVLTPHPLVYADKFQEVYSAITYTMHSITPTGSQKNLNISNAFICNHNWDWVELDPFMSSSLVGIFIHGEITIFNQEDSTRRNQISIRLPISDFVVVYSENEDISVVFHYAKKNIWCNVASIDEGYCGAYKSFLERASIDTLTRVHAQRNAKFPDPVLSIHLEALETAETRQPISKTQLSKVDITTTPLLARVKLLEKHGGCLHAWIPVTNVCIEISKSKTPSGYNLLLQTATLLWRVNHTAPGALFTHNDIQSIVTKYNWPAAEESQTWRHVVDFCCYLLDDKEKDGGHKSRTHHKSNHNSNHNTNSSIHLDNRFSDTSEYGSIGSDEFRSHFISALECTEEKKAKTIIFGKLLPPPPRPAKTSSSSISSKSSSSLPSQPMTVYIQVKKYSIDYGSSPEDENRGLWIESVVSDTWYKLHDPAHPLYASFAEDAFAVTSDILALATLLQENSGRHGLLVDKATEKIVIPCTVRELYQRLQGKLNVQFLKTHAEFALSNLDVLVNLEKSKEFKRSVLALSQAAELDVSKWSVSATATTAVPALTSASEPAAAGAAGAAAAAAAAAARTATSPPLDAAAAVTTIFSSSSSSSATTTALKNPSTISSSTNSTKNDSSNNGSSTTKGDANGKISDNYNDKNSGGSSSSSSSKRSFHEMNATTTGTGDAALSESTSHAKSAKTTDNSSAISTTTTTSSSDECPPPRKIKKKERSDAELLAEEEFERLAHLQRLKAATDDKESNYSASTTATNSNSNSSNNNNSNNGNNGSFVCSYCRSLSKRLQCQNSAHEDGKMVPSRRPISNSPVNSIVTSSNNKNNNNSSSSSSDANSANTHTNTMNKEEQKKLDLCPFCKQLSKLTTCPLSIHEDGEQLKRRLVLLGNDESHERRHYEKQHTHYLSSNAYGTAASLSVTLAQNIQSNTTNTTTNTIANIANIANNHSSNTTISTAATSTGSGGGGTYRGAGAHSRENWQGRIVEVDVPVIHHPTPATDHHSPKNDHDNPTSTSRVVVLKSALKKSADYNNNNSDTSDTTAAAAAASNERKQYLQSLKLQRQSLRTAKPAAAAAAAASAHNNNNNNSSNSNGNNISNSSASASTSTLLWQDELPASDKIIGRCYPLERIDLSQIPRYTAAAASSHFREEEEDQDATNNSNNNNNNNSDQLAELEQELALRQLVQYHTSQNMMIGFKL